MTKPIASPIRNAYIHFTKMTTSLVAVVTDAVPAVADRRAAAFRMAAIRCRSVSRPASALAATRAIPTCSKPYGGFPDSVRVEDGHITKPDLPGIGFEGRSDLYAEMKALAA